MEPRRRLPPVLALALMASVLCEVDDTPIRRAPRPDPKPIPPDTDPLAVGDMLYRGVVTEVDVGAYMQAREPMNRCSDPVPASVASTLPRGDEPHVIAAQAIALAVSPHETRAQRRERLRLAGKGADRG